MSTELLPCPFCGGSVALRYDEDSCPFVGCDPCSFQLSAYVPGYEYKAIAAWNRRATPAPAPLDAEGLPALPEPAAFCAPTANGKPLFGKGWMFGPVAVAQAQMPLYTAEQVRQAQREAVEADRRTCAKQSIDTPEFQRLLAAHANAAMAVALCEPQTMEDASKARAALIAYIDGRIKASQDASPDGVTTGLPIAWARKWHADGEKPAKARNGNGRMAWPQKFKFHAITPHKIFPDDVPLAAAPSHSPAEEDK